MTDDDTDIVFWFVLAVLVVGFTLFFFPPPKAKAHEAMSGWPYPANCCGGSDCWELPEGAVKETPAGFTLIGSGEFIPRSKAQMSGDERYHLCRFPGPTIRCFFVPNRGF